MAWIPPPRKIYYSRIPSLSPNIQEEDIKAAFINSDHPADAPLGFRIGDFGGKRTLYLESLCARPWATLIGPTYYTFKGITTHPPRTFLSHRTNPMYICQP